MSVSSSLSSSSWPRLMPKPRCNASAGPSIALAAPETKGITPAMAFIAEAAMGISTAGGIMFEDEEDDSEEAREMPD